MHRRCSALGLGRVLMLPDRREAPIPLDEPAVAGRIGGREAECDEVRAVREAGPKRGERRAANQRNVRVSDDDVVVAARDRLPRGQNRIGGAPPLALDEDLDARRGLAGRRGHILAVRADHHRDVGCAGLVSRRERVRQHRPAGDGVQNLGPARAHADALSGGEHDGEAASGVGIHGSAPGRRVASRRGRTSPAGGQASASTAGVAVRQKSSFALRQNASRGAAK